MASCDKCGAPVATDNDAVILEVLRSNIDLYVLAYAKPRHLLPVHDEAGNTLCEGSPSRAQYLEGQPRDTRYPYLPEYEAPTRAAYAAMVQEATRSLN